VIIVKDTAVNVNRIVSKRGGQSTQRHASLAPMSSARRHRRIALESAA
jgi:hypothetical protein